MVSSDQVSDFAGANLHHKVFRERKTALLDACSKRRPTFLNLIAGEEY